jgi:hypothetical protein
MGLSVTTKGGRGLFLRAGKGPEQWTKCRHISFWIYPSPEETKRREERADRLGFWFRGAANVVIETLLVEGRDEAWPVGLTDDDVRTVVFPCIAAASVTVVANGHVRILTDAPGIDGKRLAVHLASVSKQVCADLSVTLPAPSPILVIFATDAAYRSSPARIAAKSSIGSSRSLDYRRCDTRRHWSRRPFSIVQRTVVPLAGSGFLREFVRIVPRKTQNRK